MRLISHTRASSDTLSCLFLYAGYPHQSICKIVYNFACSDLSFLRANFFAYNCQDICYNLPQKSPCLTPSFSSFSYLKPPKNSWTHHQGFLQNDVSNSLLLKVVKKLLHSCLAVDCNLVKSCSLLAKNIAK